MNDRTDKRFDMNEQEIEALALHHPFGELSSAQQQLVRAELGSEAAYGQLRTMLLMTCSGLSEESVMIEPRPEIHADLRASMHRRHRATSVRFTFRDLLNYRVPAYTSAAGFALALVLALMLGESSFRQQPIVRERIVYVPAGDTQMIEVDKEEIIRRVTDSLRAELARQPAAQPVVQAVLRPVESSYRGGRRRNRDTMIPRAPKSAPARTATPAAPGNQFVGLANLPQLEVQKRGKNLAEDSSSRQFGWTAARDSF